MRKQREEQQRKENQKKREEEEKLKKEQQLKQYIDCEKCKEKYKPENEFKLECNHNICYQCLYTMFEENIINQQYQQHDPSCPICQSPIKLQIVEYVTQDQPFIIQQIKQWEQQKQYIQLDHIDYPNEWEPQNTNCVLVNLPNNHQEYNLVVTEFKKCMPNNAIIRVSRIQNQALWKNFEQEKSKLLQYKKKIGVANFPQDCNQKLLWHGTKQTNPKIIYESQLNGFNVSFSNAGGSRGKGIYFAFKSSYSAGGYQFTLPDGSFIILLCKVLVGEVFPSPGARYFEPPAKDPNDLTKGYYDSVSDQNGTEMYILYGMDCRRAYPAYELNYK